MRLFKITGDSTATGFEFEVEDDASSSDVAEAAADLVISLIDFGWEEITPHPPAPATSADTAPASAAGTAETPKQSAG